MDKKDETGGVTVLPLPDAIAGLAGSYLSLSQNNLFVGKKVKGPEALGKLVD